MAAINSGLGLPDLVQAADVMEPVREVTRALLDQLAVDRSRQRELLGLEEVASVELSTRAAELARHVPRPEELNRLLQISQAVPEVGRDPLQDRLRAPVLLDDGQRPVAEVTFGRAPERVVVDVVDRLVRALSVAEVALEGSQHDREEALAELAPVELAAALVDLAPELSHVPAAVGPGVPAAEAEPARLVLGALDLEGQRVSGARDLLQQLRGLTNQVRAATVVKASQDLGEPGVGQVQDVVPELGGSLPQGAVVESLASPDARSSPDHVHDVLQAIPRLAVVGRVGQARVTSLEERLVERRLAT